MVTGTVWLLLHYALLPALPSHPGTGWQLPALTQHPAPPPANSELGLRLWALFPFLSGICYEEGSQNGREGIWGQSRACKARKEENHGTAHALSCNNEQASRAEGQEVLLHGIYLLPKPTGFAWKNGIVLGDSVAHWGLDHSTHRAPALLPVHLGAPNSGQSLAQPLLPMHNWCTGSGNVLCPGAHSAAAPSTQWLCSPTSSKDLSQWLQAHCGEGGLGAGWPLISSLGTRTTSPFHLAQEADALQLSWPLAGAQMDPCSSAGQGHMVT